MTVAPRSGVPDPAATTVPETTQREAGSPASPRPADPTLDDVAAATGRVVDGLLAHGLPPADVAVLTPRSQKSSVLGALTSLGRAPVGWRNRPTRDHVLVDTIHRFKGLEAKAVVVTELALEPGTEALRLLRVGFSRAQTVLEVVATRSSHALLAPALPAFDVA